ncbi:iron-siderophore ABC transporter substrate-binding protein [Gloeocapsopsis sp. IPPAS B-1203]|uniref:iron-siderophore ABC transporter substrate-binding protein n=1 Tax=Gloeocapsopsis sp. IPPAS B-1203 TaxID=2049454 RepID=UPI000C17AF13|nr:iron-siderophore ABC transporter substrate-binding protein [Gloeocapsopsis sp. IPPAS B-1203]PIG94708.1 ABC transporter substrate-binding protein [Gloeocapsopsis sp. IPPAS B-1203]
MHASQCRVVEHAMGEACVPYYPQRVISLGDAANTIALGVKPVAGVFRGGFESLLGERITGIEQLPVVDPSLETIAVLNPDLILATYHKAIYNQLTQIAPTVLASWETGSDWKKVFFKEAEALGRVDQAQQLMADYETRLAQFKAEMNIDETPSGENRSNQIKVSVVRIYPEAIAIYFKDSFCGSILEDAGLSRPPAQDREWDGQQQLSKERIRDLDADVMFLWTYGYNAEIAQQVNTTLEKLKADPLWSQLKVVQQGKVYEVPSYWIGDSILAANAVLDDLFRYLVVKEE